MKHSRRGHGSVFHMKNSSCLWIKYYRGGVAIRESAHTDKLKDAEKLLRQRLGEVGTGTWTPPEGWPHHDGRAL